MYLGPQLMVSRGNNLLYATYLSISQSINQASSGSFVNYWKIDRVSISVILLYG